MCNRPRLNHPEIQLTKRQSEYFFLLAKGYSNQKIAKTLCLEVCTVEGLIKRLIGKLKVNSKFELIAEAIKAEILININSNS